MYRIRGNYYILETNDTSLILKRKEKSMEYVYYGEKISDYTGMELMEGERDGWGNQTPLSLFTQCGGTDFREPSLLVRFGDGSMATDFELVVARVCARPSGENLPLAYGAEKSLKLEYVDRPSGLKLTLYYTAFEKANTISVIARLHNGGKKEATILRLSSLQYEKWGVEEDFITFDGAWGCERRRHERKVSFTKIENSVFGGSSSHHHNPFVMLKGEDGAIGFNLLWSGSHRETAESDLSGRTRVVVGMGGNGFCYRLGAGEDFTAPEGVMAYGRTEEELRHAFHTFTLEHIVRGKWQKKARPVLFNNWEGTYFSFTREKILSLARKAAEVGAELFVLDDGWFGRRDDDRTSLGDWTDYEEKTGGLASLAEEIRGMGLKFGIWMEPEMVSEDSELYRKHPEYAMKIPKREPTRMRNQLMLNLADPQVQGYVFRAISRVLTMTKASYLKWDYNRYMTDCFDKNTPGGEYEYRYMVGLYSILQKLTERFPNVLFEGCASGGGRYDLGALCYFSQMWTSDDTDAKERLSIQSGTAICYHQSTMGNHVSASPNEQTGNSCSLENRFRVALGGVFGYELDLEKLSSEELEEIKEQISFYKEYRELLQFGEYHEITGEGVGGYLISSADGSMAICTIASQGKEFGRSNVRVKFVGFEEKCSYHVLARGNHGGVKEVGVASSDLLKKGNFPTEILFSSANPREYSNPLYVATFLFLKVCAKYPLDKFVKE